MFTLNYWRDRFKTKKEDKPMFDTVQNYVGGWFWPLAIISLLLLTNAGRKLKIVGIGAKYLLLSQDKSFKLPNYDPGTIDQNIGIKIVQKQTKTLILIRHGESTWNEVFNRGIDWKLPLRIIYALARETILFVTSDSVFYDSPLGSIGINQAKNIHSFIKSGYLNNENLSNSNLGDIDDTKEPLMKRSESAEEKINQCIDILNGKNKQGSIILSSPLRRCIETIALSCFERLTNDDKEQIHLVSTLQEMTRNIDGVSLAPSQDVPPLSWSMRSLENEYEIDFEQWMESKVSIDFKGSYKCEHQRGDTRMKQFIRWLFDSKLTSNNNTIIISGHSLWFRFFFQAYYPRNEQIDGKTQKISNGGIIALDFSKYSLSNGTTRYRIEPGSVVPVYKGFERKKKKL